MDQEKVKQENIAKKQEEALNAASLPIELKSKIGLKYRELLVKHPNWKKHRLMRKAGEFYNVKFDFE